jgi:hypothetical protein
MLFVYPIAAQKVIPEELMEKLKACAIILAIMGGFVLIGCNNGIDENDAARSILLSCLNCPHTLTIDDGGEIVTLVASSPAFGWTGDGYIGGYLQNCSDIHNSIIVRWTGWQSISAATFNQDTEGFTFAYRKKGVLWRNAHGYEFDLSLSIDSGGLLSGTFSGALTDGRGNALSIAGGSFSGSY